MTVIDDDWIRTHDEARDALRYAALGATVIIERVQREHTPDTRSFTVVLDAAPNHAVSAADAYSLPCLAAPLMRRARTLCDRARQSLVYAKGLS
ncbi:MAG: hypothetical protein IPQ07_38030 [Myxococcales bacterium]|nr:hypothetical protein [Myxococcales bacterium]